jgi:hypothetical protein
MIQIRGDLDFAQEAVGTKGCCQLWTEDLDCNLSLVLQVLSEVDRSHPTRPKLSLDLVTVSQRSLQTFQQVSHRQAPPWSALRYDLG